MIWFAFYTLSIYLFPCAFLHAVHLFVPVCILTHCPFICSHVHSYTLSIYLFPCVFLHTIYFFPCTFLHAVHLFVPVYIPTLWKWRHLICLGLRIVTEKRTEKEDRELFLCWSQRLDIYHSYNCRCLDFKVLSQLLVLVCFNVLSATQGHLLTISSAVRIVVKANLSNHK